MNRQLVYLYLDGTTREVIQNNMREDIIKSAYTNEHWNERENAYIFTVEKFNEFLKLIKIV